MNEKEKKLGIAANAPKEEIEKKAFRLARDHEKECTGCAQSTLSGIFGALEIDNDDIFKAASALSDGIGLSGEGSCGALSAGAMAIGYLFGRERKDARDITKPMHSYCLANELINQFMDKFGTTRCFDVQKSKMGRSYNLWDENELVEASESGMIEHCSDVAGTAAMMAARIILEAVEEANGDNEDEE